MLCKAWSFLTNRLVLLCKNSIRFVVGNSVLLSEKFNASSVENHLFVIYNVTVGTLQIGKLLQIVLLKSYLHLSVYLVFQKSCWMIRKFKQLSGVEEELSHTGKTNFIVIVNLICLLMMMKMMKIHLKANKMQNQQMVSHIVIWHTITARQKMELLLLLTTDGDRKMLC